MWPLTHTLWQCAKAELISKAGIPLPDNFDPLAKKSWTLSPPPNSDKGSIGVLCLGFSVVAVRLCI